MAATATLSTPLEPIFAGHAKVPFAFAEQFLHTEDSPHDVRLDGVMHTIWHRPAYLKPLFWALGRLGVLVPHNAENVPTTLAVRPDRDDRDGVRHVWDRTFDFDPPVRFRTTIVYDPRLGEVVDLVGPGDALYMVWKARFHPPDRFTLDTHACALRFGRVKLWMPRWLWKLLLGTVTFSQVAESPESDTVRIELLITHPLFGAIFGYTGTFKTVRTERASRASAAPIA